jgi:hypothetical protein
MRVDESALPAGIAMHVAVALRFLAKGTGTTTLA